MKNIPLPPGEAEERAADKEAFLQHMEKWITHLEQRNLQNAVLLAQEAARGESPLREHFMELGRVWGPSAVAREAEAKRKARARRRKTTALKAVSPKTAPLPEKAPASSAKKPRTRRAKVSPGKPALRVVESGQGGQS